MIIIYTFDFKQFVPSRENEYMILSVSIQSAIESDPKSIILLYTSDREVTRRIKEDFPSVQIRFRDKEAYCETKFFTCAGHARIDTIAQVLNEFRDNVLYLDNDTLVYPEGLSILNSVKVPMGYMLEDWNTIGNWNKINPCFGNELRKIYGADITSKQILNNGVQFFPYNEKSVETAKEIKVLYDHLLLTCGYYYGLDMTAFSVVMHDQGFTNKVFFKNKVTSTVWHTYMVKENYIKNLLNNGVFVDRTGRIKGHKNAFAKLKKRS